MNLKVEESWKAALSQAAEHMLPPIREKLQQEYASGNTVFPPPGDIFAALNMTPLTKVKVVILGQDPYHGPGQAHGLAFSVKAPCPAPPSLVNIFKEIEKDTGIHRTCPTLNDWAEQGVLLLNSALTVRARAAGSHAAFGWQAFTDSIIQVVNEKESPVAFVLWGNFARGKKELITAPQHQVLEAAHPSPFSAHNGFFGCGHFTKVNAFLKKHGQQEIRW